MSSLVVFSSFFNGYPDIEEHNSNFFKPIIAISKFYEYHTQ